MNCPHFVNLSTIEAKYLNPQNFPTTKPSTFVFQPNPHETFTSHTITEREKTQSHTFLSHTLLEQGTLCKTLETALFGFTYALQYCLFFIGVYCIVFMCNLNVLMVCV